MSLQNSLICLFCLILLAPPASAQAPQAVEQGAQIESRGDAEPPRGTGKIVGGILTASILAGLGLLVVVGSVYGDCARAEDCHKDSNRAASFGLGIAALGVGIGAPLIYFGARERHSRHRLPARRPDCDEFRAAPRFAAARQGRALLRA